MELTIGTRGTPAVIGLGGLLGVALPLLGACSSLPPHEREALEQASRAYQQGQAATAAEQLDRLARDYQHTKEIAEVHYLRGLCRTKTGQISAAAADFSAAAAKSKRADLTARAKVSLASIAGGQGRWVEAAELYSSAAGDLPDEPPTDEILLAAGVAMQRAGRWRDATFQFARILRSFRDRPVAAEARRLAAWPHEYFAIQAGAFSSTAAAEKQVVNLRSRGLEALYENVPREGSTFWVVMVGQYARYEQALEDLARVRQVEPGAFVIP